MPQSKHKTPAAHGYRGFEVDDEHQLSSTHSETRHITRTDVAGSGVPFLRDAARTVMGTGTDVGHADLRCALHPIAGELVTLDLHIAQDRLVRHRHAGRYGAVPLGIDANDGVDGIARSGGNTVGSDVFDGQSIQVQRARATIGRAIPASPQDLAGGGVSTCSINHDSREVAHVHRGTNGIVLEELIRFAAIGCSGIQILVSRRIVDGIGATSAVVACSVFADFVPGHILERAVASRAGNAVSTATSLDVKIGNHGAVLQRNHGILTFGIAIAGGAQRYATAIHCHTIKHSTCRAGSGSGRGTGATAGGGRTGLA